MKPFSRKLFIGGLALLFASACGINVENSINEDAFPSPELLSRVLPKGKHDPEAVIELKQWQKRLSDPKKQAVAELLIAAQNSVPGSPTPVAETRQRLEKLSKTHSGTWISAATQLARASTFGSFDSHQEEIQAWLDALQDPGFPELEDGKDPLLKKLLVGEAKENAKDIKDIILYKLVTIYTSGFDLKSAEKTAANIQSATWKTSAAAQITQLQKLDPVELEKKRTLFLRTKHTQTK